MAWRLIVIYRGLWLDLVLGMGRRSGCGFCGVVVRCGPFFPSAVISLDGDPGEGS